MHSSGGLERSRARYVQLPHPEVLCRVARAVRESYRRSDHGYEAVCLRGRSTCHVMQAIAEAVVDHCNKIFDQVERCSTRSMPSLQLCRRASMRSCPRRRVRFGLRASETTRSASCPTRCRPAARSTDLAGSPEMPARGDQAGDHREYSG